MRKLFLIITMVCMLPLMGECADYQLVNGNATDETQLLANNLSSSMKNTTSLWYGEQYSGGTTDPGTFGTVEVSGKYPYVWGEDFNWIDAKRKSLANAHSVQGGVITISWHMQNWVTGGDQYDETGNPVVNIITGGTHVSEYQDGLDSLASFCDTFKDKYGNLIPIIFRPFHENDGDWFWWGTDTCTDAQFQQLWQETYTYLTTTKSVNNLIWCYSPEYINSDATDRYPGNNYVDIMGVDKYGDTAAGEIDHYQDAYDESITNGKLFAITEGLRNLSTDPLANYWTTTATAVLGDSKAKNAAYMMFWGRSAWGVDSDRIDADNFATAVSNGSFEMIDYTYVTLSGEGTGTITIGKLRDGEGVKIK